MTLHRRQLLSGLGLAATLPAVGFARHSSIWIPIGNLPRPKFHLGQEVLASWEDGDENAIYHSPALIIGMIYSPEDHESGWWYLPRWIEHPQWWIVGKDDGNYCAEDQLRALS